MKIKTRKFQKNGQVAAIDGKYTGEEATWIGVDTKEAYDKKLSKALNFYNYYLDRDDYIPIIYDYMITQGYNPKQCKLIQKVPKTAGEVSLTGKLCRMFNMGSPDYYNYRKLVKTNIASMLNQASSVEDKKVKADTDAPAKPNVHEIMKEKVRKSILCEL